MLVVVHHRDVEQLLETVFYLKALGRGDVLEVDAPKGGGNRRDCFNNLLRLLRVEYEGNPITVFRAGSGGVAQCALFRPTGP